MSSPKTHSLFVSVACLSFAVFGCGNASRAEVGPTHAKNTDNSVELHGASASYIRVEPAAAAERNSERSLVARVAFDDRKLAVLGPPVQGRVASVEVVAGDRVAKGALLLTLRAPDIAAASAQLTEAKTTRLLAERNAERAKLLLDHGAGSQAESQQADSALAQARAEERRAGDVLNAFGGSHGSNEYQLRSPIAGVVVERNVAVGSEVHVDQDKPLLTVADLSTLWVNADVYEQDLARIHVGDEARVHVPAFAHQEPVGRITYVGNTIDPVTRVAIARIEIQNPDSSLRPGMFATVQVKGLSDGVVDVPIAALLARRDQFFVFTKNPNGTFAQREVKPGEQHGQHVQILSGLVPGDPVVTEGAILLDAEANEAL
ncbi:MAG TPA: efflux RND transporter periplasmic adaptor subunit [Polyangiaceae bacterium]|nr:efflux RND transporter periplasmic adaptor subunit [Polyangiaceae bacterium]